jgi:hypothetical protein
VLGDWYATLPRWRLPVALFVNEATLLPLLVRLTPPAASCTASPQRSPRH